MSQGQPQRDHAIQLGPDRQMLVAREPCFDRKKRGHDDDRHDQHGHDGEREDEAEPGSPDGVVGRLFSGPTGHFYIINTV